MYSFKRLRGQIERLKNDPDVVQCEMHDEPNVKIEIARLQRNSQMRWKIAKFGFGTRGTASPLNWTFFRRMPQNSASQWIPVNSWRTEVASLGPKDF